MQLTIFGTGYVGLVTGACLAEVGHHVLCVDVDEEKINCLLRGEIPIFEPGLEALVQRNFDLGRLQFTTDVRKGVEYAEIQFIAVGTPPDEDGSADLQYLLAVARNIGRYMSEPRLIIDKSTVPVGTADKVRATVQDQLAERSLELSFDVVSNPEFLKEGAAIEDFMKPDRIVVGSDNDRSRALMRELYAPFNRSSDRMVFMDLRSAELTKYAANAMLATKISFMNEMANLAERLGADIEQVRRGIGSDPRIGYHFIYPGCGYGGSCFPKDVQALERTAREVGYEAELLSAVEGINQRQKHRLYQRLEQYFSGALHDKTIALWGLAFKPKTDDMREAPSRTLMEALWAVGAQVKAYDPQAMEEARRIYGDSEQLTLCNSAEEALRGADVLAICTEWSEFRAPDFDLIRETLSIPAIFDGRNLYDPATLREYGLDYIGIGQANWPVSTEVNS
ncbi:UDP-glucose/GDP-mannose dehydrogenase family protein [Aestuariirhabdus sp. Z084]|uniref:UDP-glucose dehydrogenase family protein n=1 Tax=Aestuariirhabdus haliotis TaxID=2918751 RepID=UPI00201B36F3|nr:UDP-glucose/GDP-mannose dehydrogenase family protein [Aestuariirhabdus haliotis]MCL6415468.1 UDP-glucose/GDP-mannose dehydrogenase family protein [Aestuariirhabdus haliotis]MCL6419327.1 UDP-glucose/GDP-mannose dehydrogenase family protein [Aestuariirhabdus haliotis]